MAGYENDWRRRRRREGQPWASRRGHDHSEFQGEGYGVDYRGRGYPYGTGYRRGSEGDFGSESRIRAGTGYDFGYQGGEYGRPVNAPGFGTRGSYRTPSSGSGRGFGSGSAGQGLRSGGGPAGYGGDYENWGGSGSRGGGGFGRRGYAGEFGPGSGRGYRYDREYGGSSRRPSWSEGGTSQGTSWSPSRGALGERGRDFGGSGRQGSGGNEGGSSRHSWSSSGRSSGEGRRDSSRDFGGRQDRHYGHSPNDRWPSDEGGYDGRMSDDDVIESVRENLFQDSFVHADRIDVDVDDGIVTLRGDVDDFLQARYAWDDAWESPGVRGVINNLTVRTDLPSDQMNMPQTEGSHPSGSVRRSGRSRGS